MANRVVVQQANGGRAKNVPYWAISGSSVRTERILQRDWAIERSDPTVLGS